MIDPFVAEVGVRVRKVRNARGMTQRQLGGLIGVSRESIANFEVGRQNIPLDRFGHIADALGVPPGSLVGEVDIDAMLASAIETVKAEWLGRYGKAAEAAAVRLRETGVAVTRLMTMIKAAEDGHGD